MRKKSIKDIDIKNKRVLIRVDFNVPQDKDGQITDDTRIRAAIPTIQYALSENAMVILISHLGRPKGKVDPRLSLAPVAKRLSEVLNGMKVELLNDCVGPDITDRIKKMNPKDIVLLENVRFHKEEEANDPEFSKRLAELADVFVNDAFGTCHRAHSSTVGVTKYLPSVAGFLVQKEIEYFEKAVSEPSKPYVAVLGGAKVSDKIDVLKNLIQKVDSILIGGAMAYTFLKSKGISVGNSKLESDKLDIADETLRLANEKNVKVCLPVDHIGTKTISEDAEITVVSYVSIPDGIIGVDIGPKTIELFKNELKDAKTIVWNGPLGLFEIEKFQNGSKQIAEFIADLEATTIIGGGDTAAAIAKFGLEDKMSHISTGGGASLEYLEGKTLPGIAVLLDQ